MAFELPVVATRIFGVPETIEDGRTGWLCEPRDVGALAGALDRALCAPRDDVAALAGDAARAARARHDAAVYADRFAGLLEGLAADPAADPAALVGVRGESIST
jgi:glycosyltransferase involved in cell wall biosynthesis